jgi:hypothetical protein
MVTQVLPVAYRDPRELLEVLRPLVPPPGSVSAFNDQLVVRTTPGNMASLRGLLLELDRAPANLVISVRRSLDEEVRRDLLAARVTARGGGVSASTGASPRDGSGRSTRGGVSISAGAGSRLSTAGSEELQRIRVLEGREAFIEIGQDVPFRERTLVVGPARVIGSDSIRYESFGSGLWVRPRLHAHGVTVDILRGQRTLGSDWRAEVDQVQTSVSGELGRWMELAGTGASQAGSSSASGSVQHLDTRRETGVYVKVERAAP